MLLSAAPHVIVWCMGYEGDRVQIDLMIRGYGAAQARYAHAAELSGPEPAYFSLFECLNWATAIDEVVGEIWRPWGTREGHAWRKRIAGAELLKGVRTARNLIHHHWARAPHFRVVEGRTGWVWPATAELPPPTSKWDQKHGLPAYDDLMAGERVVDTLHSVGAIFASVETFLVRAVPQ